MTAATKLATIYDFFDREKDKIGKVKVTKVIQGNFNDMEGYQYRVNFKFFTKEGYRNKLVAWLTNSTYTDNYIDPDSSLSYEDQLKQELEDTFFNRWNN